MLGRIDDWQQRRRGTSLFVATILRYREDRGRQYGALLSYYGFISLFPLLLVLVTVLVSGLVARRARRSPGGTHSLASTRSM